jgi:hypothetical protein
MGWKLGKPGISGFLKSYKKLTYDGVLLEVDYNPTSRVVRLSASTPPHGMITHACSVSEGVVLKEKMIPQGNNDAAGIFNRYKEEYDDLNDLEVLDCIGGVFGILVPQRKIIQTSRRRVIRIKIPPRNPQLPSIPKASSKNISYAKDWFDMAICLLVGFLVYTMTWRMGMLGMSLACMGMLTGGMDFFRKSRQIFWGKVFFFLATGIGVFYYGFINE